MGGERGEGAAAGRHADLVAAATRALGSRNLVLVGFMGSGKTTLGRAAAEALARPFADTDEEVQRRAGRPIPVLFAERGEAAFRALEAQAVADLAAPAGRVLATGGGALADPASVAALRAGGVLVALHARPEVLLDRVGGARAAATRPLLAGSDPLARIRHLLAARADMYAQADLALDTSDLDPAGALRALLCAVAAWAGGRGAGRGGGGAGRAAP